MRSALSVMLLLFTLAGCNKTELAAKPITPTQPSIAPGSKALVVVSPHSAGLIKEMLEYKNKSTFIPNGCEVIVLREAEDLIMSTGPEKQTVVKLIEGDNPGNTVKVMTKFLIPKRD